MTGGSSARGAPRVSSARARHAKAIDAAADAERTGAARFMPGRATGVSNIGVLGSTAALDEEEPDVAETKVLVFDLAVLSEAMRLSVLFVKGEENGAVPNDARQVVCVDTVFFWTAVVGRRDAGHHSGLGARLDRRLDLSRMRPDR